MKLIKLELLDDFRSLKSGFKVNFLDGLNQDNDIKKFDSYCIVGRNGSGKSNILEVLSAIFYQLEIDCLNFLPKERAETEDGDIEYNEMELFLSQSKEPNSYLLEYWIDNSINGGYKKVTIKKENDKRAQFYIDSDFENPLSVKEAKDFLPSYIVGYSSGENEILSLPFLRMRMIQYDEYAHYLAQDMHYNAPEARLVYLDETFSQAIFITNFLFPDDAVHKIFKDTIGIKNVKEFRIVINKSKTTTGLYDENYTLYDGVSSKIENLKSCATLYYDDTENNQLILDFYVDDACRDAFKKFF